MIAARASPADIGSAQDGCRPYLPEAFTPLYHTAAYATLAADVRRRYNQLYGLYFNEQITFFETSLAESVLRPLAGTLPEPLASGLIEFIAEERRHTLMFRALNRACAPELYAAGDFHFVRVPAGYAGALAWIARRARYFPMVLWLMLLQEERSIFYSRTIIREGGALDPRFVTAHRVHLRDEAGHVGWDEQLLDELWAACGGLLRRLNAGLFRWMVGEFFNTPRRGGLSVLEQLAREFEEVVPGLPALQAEVLALGRSEAYHRTLYSREIVPRTFARFDRWPEFASLGRTLYGYHPRHDAAPHRV